MLLVLWKKWFARQAPADDPNGGETAEEMVKAIQAGDESLRESLIASYRPFVAKTASRFCGRYVDPAYDDEFSVALAAFDEAINRYSPEAGSGFIGFARTVMTRRLIDYARQEKRHASAIPYSAFTGEDENGGSELSRIENAAALEAYELDRDADRRREEITALAEQLARFEIRFQDLADGSPRHRDSRQTLLRIGRKIAETPEWYRMLREKRQLPVKELCAAETVSRKTVERHRKYLIAVSLIAGGPYPCLKAYIAGERASGEDERP
ncbi:RNA polymerase sigma-I factor [Cohnella caldifontis]|uniref:RNA polymerase sigma-I factor n=1 Tax=Cohnella caldifontis TaxID=3027471 RepID=UPI0023EB39F3|nr:RNA polymerase sigma-I factor [Cohnella sp. YIM B05605]